MLGMLNPIRFVTKEDFISLKRIRGFRQTVLTLNITEITCHSYRTDKRQYHTNMHIVQVSTYIYLVGNYFTMENYTQKIYTLPETSLYLASKI